MIFQAFILGLVQAFGEFLPISSSAHLIIVPWLCRWEDPGLTFDVALHVGTLLAVIGYFWKDWVELIMEGAKGFKTRNGKIFWFIVIATIPGAILGKLFDETVENAVRNPLLIGVLLIVMGIVLGLADRVGGKNKEDSELNVWKSVCIGFAQAVAIIPGVSRSGATISAGLFLGLKRAEAARFSFLMSTPIIAGAALLKLHHIPLSSVNAPFIVGVSTSAIGGFLVIGVFMKWIRQASYMPFVWYRIVVGAAVIAIALLRK
jgi:undecaprenyl-diphosphatase